MILEILAVVITPVNEVGKFLFGSLKHQIDYLTDYDTNIQNLRREAEQLKVKRSNVQDLVKEARRRSDIPYKEVVQWLKDAETTEEEMKNLIDEEVNVKMKCLIGLCPDLCSRLKLSKEAATKVKCAISLQNNASFSPIAHPPPPSGVDIVHLGILTDIPSRNSILNGVVTVLGDDNFGTIAVHGMAGIGKTTLMKRINNDPRVSQFFKKIILVTVKRDPDLKAIQDYIADSLGLPLRNEASEQKRANMLRERLKCEEKVLIILDNVWMKINLTEIGIPSASEHAGCKVILSTRDSDVCTQMSIKEIIRMDFLSETESWTLFKSKTGDVVESPNLNSKAMGIVKICHGSPLAIVSLGSALKEQGDEYAWSHALSVLMHSNPSGVEGIMPDVVESVRISYDSLRLPEIKFCFLFCCLFPAGYNIKLSDLRNYGVGVGFLKLTETLDGALNELRSHVEKLKNCCLLLEGDDKMSVKMHDVIHVVARLIALKDYNGLQGFQRETEKLRGYKRISLMNNDTKSSSPALNFIWSLLRSLLIRENRLPTAQTGQDSFFERMTALGVLDLWRIHDWDNFILSTQQSLSHLTHLRTLYLIACDVSGKVSLLGELKTLEILSLRESRVERLEKEIGKLTNLKCLDLTGAVLKYVAPNVISRLSKLEELYMWNSFEGWDVKFDRWHAKGVFGSQQNAQFSEVASLHHVAILEIRVKNVVSHDIHSAKNLKQFRVAINDKPSKVGRCVNNNELCIKKTNLAKHWVNKLMSNSRKKLVLSIESCYGFNNIADLDVKDLEYLEVHCCDEIKCVIRIEQSKEAPRQLKVVRVLGCPKLKNIFSSNIFSPVWCLEDVTVGNCDELKEVFNLEDDVRLSKAEGTVGLVESEIQEIGALPVTAMFPVLQRIELFHLKKLTTIWKGFIPDGGFGHLRELRVRHCDSLKYLLSEGLQSLETLEIFNCSKLEKLTHFKREGATQRHTPNLRYLKIIECPRLKKLFSFDIAQDLQLLKSLCIQDCNNLMEIVGNEEDQKGEEEAVDSQALLSQLQFLKIENLRTLKSFYQGNLLINCPLLDIRVTNCPHFRWLKPMELEDGSQLSMTSSDKEPEGEKNQRQEEEFDEEAESFYLEDAWTVMWLRMAETTSGFILIFLAFLGLGVLANSATIIDRGLQLLSATPGCSIVGLAEGEEIDKSDEIQHYDRQAHETPIRERKNHDRQFSNRQPAVSPYCFDEIREPEGEKNHHQEEKFDEEAESFDLEDAWTVKWPRLAETTSFIFTFLAFLGHGVLANSAIIIYRGLQLLSATPGFSILGLTEGEEIDKSDEILHYDRQAHETPICERQNHERQFSNREPAVPLHYFNAIWELSVEGEEIDKSDEIQHYHGQGHETPIRERQFSNRQPAVPPYYYYEIREDAWTVKWPQFAEATTGFNFIFLAFLGLGVLANSAAIIDRGFQLFSATPEFGILMNWNKSPFLPFYLAKETQAEWRPEQEAFLIDLMKDMVIERGENTLEEKFSKEEWLKMQTEYYMEWRLKYKLRAFKEMYKTLKQRFTEFKKLRENFSGLDSDSEFTIDAPDSWWDSYVKIHPSAKRFKSHGCPECEKLEIVFGITIEPGQLQTNDNDSAKGKNLQGTYEFESKDSMGPELSVASTMQAQASHAKQEMISKATIAECTEILNAMDIDIGRRTYMRAIKLLQDKGWREVFLHMSDARRKEMLLSIEDGDL